MISFIFSMSITEFEKEGSEELQHVISHHCWECYVGAAMKNRTNHLGHFFPFGHLFVQLVFVVAVHRSKSIQIIQQFEQFSSNFLIGTTF